MNCAIGCDFRLIVRNHTIAKYHKACIMEKRSFAQSYMYTVHVKKGYNVLIMIF